MSLLNRRDRIAIFGSRGMVGRAINRDLKKAGYHNLLTPPREKLDLLDSNAVNTWYQSEKPSVVILAAAKVGGISANSSYSADFLLENLKIQTNVIEGAWRTGVHRLLFLGSSCIYPKFSPQPIREEYLLTAPLEPTNDCYAIAKITGIKLCESLRKQYGFDAISLMPTNLYGPGDNYHPENSHVMPALIRKFYEAKISNANAVTCWGTGSPLREFLYVDDLAYACRFALEKWDPDSANAPRDINGNILTYLNVGTNTDLRIDELALMVANALGYSGKIFWDKTRPDGTPRKKLDISRIAQLGWRPTTPLKSGISATIESYKSVVS